jgi:flagellar basal body-associated protein FliL
MADAPANSTPPPSPAGTTSRKPRKRRVATIAVVLIGTGAGIWWGFVRPRGVSSAIQTSTPTASAVLPLESFTVNLADPEEGRFLRATLALGVDGQLPTIAKGENKPVESNRVSMATIRDSILTVLAQCTSDQLLTPEGKAKLKADLINSLNRDVPELHVHTVYFTEFLVQR